MMLFH